MKTSKEKFRAAMGEFVGCAFVSFFGLGLLVPFAVTGAIATLTEFAIWFGVAFALTVMFTAPISGAHLNPCVTVALATFGDFDKKQVPGYLLAQVLGWGIGTVPLFLIYDHLFAEWAVMTGGNPATLFACAPAAGHAVSGAFLEMAMTALLVFAIFAMLDERVPNRPTKAMFPIVISAIISFDVALGAEYAGTSINSARDFGPRVASLVYGLIKGYDVSPLFGNGTWLIYILAPMIGGLLGAAFHVFVVAKLFPKEEK